MKPSSKYAMLVDGKAIVWINWSTYGQSITFAHQHHCVITIMFPTYAISIIRGQFHMVTFIGKPCILEQGFPLWICPSNSLKFYAKMPHVYPISQCSLVHIQVQLQVICMHLPDRHFLVQVLILLCVRFKLKVKSPNNLIPYGKDSRLQQGLTIGGNFSRKLKLKGHSLEHSLPTD